MPDSLIRTRVYLKDTASIAYARRWKFTIGANGDLCSRDLRVVQVPIPPDARYPRCRNTINLIGQYITRVRLNASQNRLGTPIAVFMLLLHKKLHYSTTANRHDKTQEYADSLVALGVVDRFYQDGDFPTPATSGPKGGC